MTITAANLAVCQQALYLLRQDVGLPSVTDAATDTTLEWQKCKIAFDTALAEVWNSHDWCDSWATAESGRADAALKCDTWPEPVKTALAYCVARELAIPLAGRVEDLKNWDGLYREKLAKARVFSLETERRRIVNADTTSRDLLAQLLPRFSETANPLPRSVSSIISRADSLTESARYNVLTAQAWNFARAEEDIPSCQIPHGAGDYQFASELPAGCARLLAVYSHGGQIDEWKVFGRTVVAMYQIRTAIFIRDAKKVEKWPPLVYQCFILRLAADVAQTEMPELQPILEQRYAAAIAEAKCRDARESSTPSEIAGRNHYVDAMHGRDNGAPRLPRHSFHGLI